MPASDPALGDGGGKLILVGRVAGGFGVRGEVRITTYTADPLALLRYRDLKRQDGSPALTLSAARPAKGCVIARTDEVATKEAADALRGLRLYVPRAALPAPDDDEFYLADLIGLKAETSDGVALGRVKAVHDFGAGDILEIDAADGRPSLLVPFTREAVPEIDIAAGRIVAIPPAGATEADEHGVGGG